MVGTAPIFHEIRQNLFALREIFIPNVAQIGREIWKVDIEKHLRPLVNCTFNGTDFHERTHNGITCGPSVRNFIRVTLKYGNHAQKCVCF